MPKKMDPDERRGFEELRARWDRNNREFEAMYERFKARWREAEEREARRRERLRRMTFGLLGRP
jgi:hypothetical protein